MRLWIFLIILFIGCDRWITDGYVLSSLAPPDIGRNSKTIEQAVQIAEDFGRSYGFHSEKCGEVKRSEAKQYSYCREWHGSVEICGILCSNKSVVYRLWAKDDNAAIHLEFDHGLGLSRQKSAITLRDNLVSALKLGLKNVRLETR